MLLTEFLSVAQQIRFKGQSCLTFQKIQTLRKLVAYNGLLIKRTLCTSEYIISLIIGRIHSRRESTELDAIASISIVEKALSILQLSTQASLDISFEVMYPYLNFALFRAFSLITRLGESILYVGLTKSFLISTILEFFQTFRFYPWQFSCPLRKILIQYLI